MTARDYLAAVQQRADAATDGPWMKDSDEPAIVLKPDGPGGWDGTAIATVQRDDFGLVEEANTEFIAAARTDVPRLVAALTGVLDLHRPEKPTGNRVTDATPPYCGGCYEAGGYDAAPLWEDCPTLAVITAALDPA